MAGSPIKSLTVSCSWNKEKIHNEILVWQAHMFVFLSVNSLNCPLQI